MKGFKKTVSGFLTFIPNLDGDLFPKPLDELRKEAPKKQMMTGVDEYEGLLLGLLNPAHNPADVGLNLTPKGIYGSDVVSNPEEVQKKFYERYTEGVDKSDENAMKKKLAEAVGDEFFNVGVLQAAKAAAKHGNEVYFYTFEYTNPEGFGMFAELLPFKGDYQSLINISNHLVQLPCTALNSAIFSVTVSTASSSQMRLT